MSKEYVAQLEATIENLRRDNGLLKEELAKYKNAEPTKALELVGKMANYILLDEEYGFIDEEEKQIIIKDRDTIEQALIQGENNRVKLEKSEKIISRLIDKKSKKEIALDIIKKKCFNNDNLAILSDFADYPRYISHFKLSVGPKAILGYDVKEEDLLDENEYNILVEFFKNDKKGESAA